MSDRRRSFYGWGYEDDQASDDELRWFEKTWSNLFGVDRFEPMPMPRESEIELRARACSRPRACRRSSRATARAAVPQLRALGARPGAHDPQARLLQPAGLGRVPARRERGPRAARLVQRGRHRGDPVRWRLERRRRCQPARRRSLPGLGHDRHESHGPRPRGRSGVAGRAHPGGRAGPLARALRPPPDVALLLRPGSSRRWAAGCDGPRDTMPYSQIDDHVEPARGDAVRHGCLAPAADQRQDRTPTACSWIRARWGSSPGVVRLPPAEVPSDDGALRRLRARSTRCARSRRPGSTRRMPAFERGEAAFTEAGDGRHES